jgi:hypothetical protein
MPRWVIPVVIGSSALIAVVVAVLWYVIGGWPRDHDRYGAIPIPGQETVRLPEGEVRLSFEGGVSGGGESRTLEDPPPGLEVRISQFGDRRLEVESVSSSLYSITSGDRGHEPYGKTEVPAAGRYQVRTTAQSGTRSGRITLGPALWNPLDSRAAGALMAGLGVLLVLLLFELPILLLIRRRSSPASSEPPAIVS